MSIPVISTDELRRRLAGLADPAPVDDGPGSSRAVRDAAVRLGTVLARLFGDDLDRITLWDRIASAFASACSQVDDGDLDRYVTILLEHIKAAPGRAAANEPLTQLIATFAAWPIEWRQAFVHYARTHSYSIISHMRLRHELVKKGEADL